MSRRVEQVAAVLQREIGRILSEGLSDPRVRGMISVTGVEVSPDRRQAVVSVSIMPEKHEKATLSGLRHARQHIQKELAKRVVARQLPRLEFKLDQSLKKQARAIEAINAATADDLPEEQNAGDQTPDTDETPEQ